MKRKFLVGLLCLAVFIAPNLVHAEGIKSTSFTADEITKLKSYSASDNVEKTVGNVSMLKYITNDFIVLTFSFDNESDTYSSILATLKNILTDGQYEYFKSNYSKITDEETVLFTGFKIYQKSNEFTQAELGKFEGKIVRVAICVNNLDDIPSTNTSTPEEKTEVTNPSTGDTNVVLLGIVILGAVGASYYSVKKIRAN